MPFIMNYFFITSLFMQSQAYGTIIFLLQYKLYYIFILYKMARAAQKNILLSFYSLNKKFKLCNMFFCTILGNETNQSSLEKHLW